MNLLQGVARVANETAMRELVKNIEAYDALRDQLEREHQGRVALLHDGELVGIYNDVWDTYVIGMERFGEGCFSLKTVGDQPASFGAAASYTRPGPIA